MTKMTAYGFVIVTILFTVLGQILIKWQTMHAGSLPIGWPERLVFFLHLVLNPWIIVGLLSAVVAACAWIMAMTRLPLNVAYPFVSVTYPLVFVLGWLLFGEPLSQWRVVGMCFILLGVVFVGFN